MLPGKHIRLVGIGPMHLLGGIGLGHPTDHQPGRTSPETPAPKHSPDAPAPEHQLGRIGLGHIGLGRTRPGSASAPGIADGKASAPEIGPGRHRPREHRPGTNSVREGISPGDRSGKASASGTPAWDELGREGISPGRQRPGKAAAREGSGPGRQRPGVGQVRNLIIATQSALATSC
jgi:hypothetical protein